MYQPLYEHISSILSPKQTGFHFAQHYLMFMIEQFKESRDKRGEFGAVFTVLPKRCDCIDHNLLITKLSWYRVTLKSHDIISSYLSSHTQDFRTNNSYSRKSYIKYGASQSLVLGPLLFNIDLVDLLVECKDANI